MPRLSDKARVTERLDGMAERLDTMNAQLDTMDGRLERVEQRQNDTEIRVIAELTVGNELLREVRDAIRGALVDRKRLNRLEKRVETLEKRTG